MLGVLPFVEDPDLSVSAACATSATLQAESAYFFTCGMYVQCTRIYNGYNSKKSFWTITQRSVGHSSQKLWPENDQKLWWWCTDLIKNLLIFIYSFFTLKRQSFSTMSHQSIQTLLYVKHSLITYSMWWIGSNTLFTWYVAHSSDTLLIPHCC